MNLLGRAVWDKTGVRLCIHPLLSTKHACHMMLKGPFLSKVLSALGLVRKDVYSVENPIILRFIHGFKSKSLCGSEALVPSVSTVRANLTFTPKKSLTYKASVFQTDSSSFAFTSSEN